jgi:hypothetical protein
MKFFFYLCTRRLAIGRTAFCCVALLRQCARDPGNWSAPTFPKDDISKVHWKCSKFVMLKFRSFI